MSSIKEGIIVNGIVFIICFAIVACVYIDSRAKILIAQTECVK